MRDALNHIALWSGPRNISTAMMYSFAQHPEVSVVDEPLYGHFLNHTGADRPDREETLQALNTDPIKVIDEYFASTTPNRWRFTKNIAHHLVGINWEFLSSLYNVILIREPEKVILSYTKQITHPTTLDLAFQIQRELLDYCLANDLNVKVIHAKNILQDPKTELRKLCDWCGLHFNENMLRWEAGARPEDGPWAKYWYHAVHKSTGFDPYISQNQLPLPAVYHELLTDSLFHYNYLLNFID
jgi:hypothetical protein